ncbi:MAG: AraC family transcriptional regulator [Roseateles depolymerans]|uniref:AraC family transcriptional regulator n=1 Tax=Roseateles depolymerans TaxID=76731 RepID=A0A2W5FLN2_9BURK|nr:MAG: AraC family transcriptional regulator [Roseateles depolymerans]
MTPTFHFAPPSPALRGWVRQHQVIRLRFDDATQVPVKPYWPRPAASLAFYLRDAEHVAAGPGAAACRKPRSALIGQPSVATLRQGGADFSVYQIEFEPGALFRLTGLPLQVLTDTWTDAEQVFPAPFRALVDRLAQHETPAQLIALAEDWLLRLVRASTRGMTAADVVAQRLLHEPGRDLAGLARRHGLDPRQLRRLFEARTGVSPRLFGRVARFDRLVRLANEAGAARWLDLALDAGYHDHQHLARDFRDFTGLSPSAFRQLELQAPERQFGFRE